MKKFALAVLFALLLPVAAYAAASGEATTYRAMTNHVLTVDNVSNRMTSGVGPFITVVRVHPTEDTWLVVGNSTATAISPVTTSALTAASFLPADVTEYFWINPGQYIAVVWDGTKGVLYISEMSR